MTGQDWMEKDFYAVLGVPKDADEATIKKAYRKLARELHPDHNPGDARAEARFKEVGEAYAVLSDPEERAKYDQVRAFAGGARFSAPSGAGGFEDILGGLFGGGGGFRAAPRRGADIAAATTLPFRQAAAGSTVTLAIDGRTVTARIPAGVRDGQKIRIPRRGRPGEGGGEPGDLVVTVHVEPHPVFSLDGKDLRVTVPVTFPEAALGATVTVPTLDGGSVRVKVPAGTPSGRVLRVRGKGVTTAKGTGDLLVTVQVVVPQKLDKAAKAAVEQFAEATAGADPRTDLFARAAE